METRRLAREERRTLSMRQISLALLVHASEKIRLTVSNVNMSFLTAGVVRMRVPVMITALSTGDIDYTMVFGSVVRAALRGLPVKVVASFLDGSAHALVARAEFKSVRELGGRTLGIESHGASSDVVARMMIKHFGIDPEKGMKIVALGGDQARLAALKEGLVDVVVISPRATPRERGWDSMFFPEPTSFSNFHSLGLGLMQKRFKKGRIK